MHLPSPKFCYDSTITIMLVRSKQNSSQIKWLLKVIQVERRKAGIKQRISDSGPRLIFTITLERNKEYDNDSNITHTLSIPEVKRRYKNCILM